MTRPKGRLRLLAVSVSFAVSLLAVFAGNNAQATETATVTLAAVPGPSGHAVETGTAVFDGHGQCGGQAPLAPPVPFPGNDCSPSDNIVRTSDLVSFGFSVSVTGLNGATDAGGAEFLDDVSFTQTLTANDSGALVTFLGIPPGCRTGANPDTGRAYEPQSALIGTSPESLVLVCNVGRLQGPTQTLFLRTQVRAGASASNGSSLASSAQICDPQNGGCTVTSNASEPPPLTTNNRIEPTVIFISGAPQFDLALNNYGPNKWPAITNIGDPKDPSDDQGGFQYVFYPTIEVDAATDGKGSVPLGEDPITFDTTMFVQGTDQPIPGYRPLTFDSAGNRVQACGPNPWSGRPIPFGRTGVSGAASTARSVADSGSIQCDQSGPGAPIRFSLTDTDTSSQHFPSLGSDGKTALSPPYYVAVPYLRLWLPNSVVDRYDPGASCSAAASNEGFAAPFCGNVDGVGLLPVTFCASDFDPNGMGSAAGIPSNYGEGLESLENNCVNTSFTLEARGSWYPFYTKQLRNSGSATGGIPVGQTYFHTGDGPIEPEQSIVFHARFGNRGSSDLTGVVICDRLDNIALGLVPIRAVGGWVPVDDQGRIQPAFARTDLNATPNQIVEYSSGLWNTDHLAGERNSISQLFDQSFAAEQSKANCDDVDGDWNTDPYAFDADANRSLAMINSVRVKLLDPLAPGDYIGLQMQLEANDRFSGGPNDGQLIPQGTIVPNFAKYKANELNQGLWHAGSGSAAYDQNTDRGASGDRMLFSRGHTDVAKFVGTVGSDLQPGSEARAAVAGGLAGDGFKFRLEPAVVTNNGLPSKMNEVVVTDVIGEWLALDLECTQSISSAGLPIVSADTPKPGETTLTWHLGTVVANTQLDAIEYCVSSDSFAPDGTNVFATAHSSGAEEITAIEKRSASSTVVLNQIGEFRIAQSVDSSIDPVDNNQVYELKWRNSSDFVTLAQPTLITVLPHLSDGPGGGSGAPRSLASSFAGTSELTREPTATMAGAFYFTKRATVEIAASPNDPSNALADSSPDADDDGHSDDGKTVWCRSASFGSNGCPGSYGETSGILFAGAQPIPPLSSGSATFELLADGNLAGDRYTSRFSAATPTLPGQTNLSNTVRVEIASVSVGDFVFLDHDDDGTFDPGQGEQPVADGTRVELLLADGSATGLSTETVDGRYVFTGLAQGTYAVVIRPADKSLLPSRVTGLTGDDRNEDVDQHGHMTGGGIATAPIDLLFEISAPDPNGDIDPIGIEPIGEDVAGIDFTTLDSLSNLTLDIGLLGTPSLETSILLDGEPYPDAPGAPLTEESFISWTYIVTNNGAADLFNVQIVDSLGLTLTCDEHRDDVDRNTGVDLMRVGDSIACSASSESLNGPHSNTMTASGTDARNRPVNDSDLAHYFGVESSVDIEKTTNGEDADEVPGPLVESGSTVEFVYRVTNTGGTSLVEVLVTDDAVDDSIIDCGDGVNTVAQLLPEESVICTASGTAIGGQQGSAGHVTGLPAFTSGLLTGASEVNDSDPSHHLGLDGALHIETLTNGADSDTPTGALVVVGDDIEWTYVVSNATNTEISDLVVTDDQGVAVDCGEDFDRRLASGASHSCTASGIADTKGQYSNIGAATGLPVLGAPNQPVSGSLVAAEDSSHFIADVAGVDVEVSPLNPELSETRGDQPMTWTYLVTNSGSLVLTDVAVENDLGDPILCEGATNNVIAVMLPGDTVNCSSEGFVGPGPNPIEATSSGLPSAEMEPGTYSVIPVPNGERMRVVASDTSVVHLDATPVVSDPGAPGLPDLVLDKTVDKAATSRGESLQYLVIIENRGDGPATNVQVVDSLPTGLDFVSASGQATYDPTSHAITWDLGQLDTNSVISVVYTVLVSTDGQTLTNTASATSDEADLVPADNTDSTEVTVDGFLATPPASDPPTTEPTTPSAPTPAPTPDAAPAPAPQTLAYSGVSTAVLLGTGIFLVLIGAWLVGEQRRRQPDWDSAG